MWLGGGTDERQLPAPKWGVPMDIGERARQEIHGNSASYYIEELTAIRAQTLDQFRRYDDAWLWREAEWNDAIANNYWMWYHVYEDEINHRGEISWKLSRMSAM
jgi:hypothetical protein